MHTDRPTWEQPAMTVLTRNRPEEAVMTICKEMVTAGGSPSEVAGGCQYSVAPCQECDFSHPS